MSEFYILRCPDCKTKNRIPVNKAEQTAKCGKCKNPLRASDFITDTPIEVTDGNFDELVLKSPFPVLLDCWAPWCGPCRQLGPVIAELAKELKGKVRVAKLNTEENRVVPTKFNIQSIPTMLVFDAGAHKDTMIGALPKRQIFNKMKPHFNK